MPWAADHIFAAGGDFVSQNWGDFQGQTGASAVVVISAAPPEAGSYQDPPPWALLWLPVEAEAAYTLEHLRLGVQFIDAALEAGRTVLLHGPRGLHLARPLVAAHLVSRGRSLARVLREMEQKPWLPPYRGEAALLEAWARQGQ